jgi:hypothetical protein
MNHNDPLTQEAWAEAERKAITSDSEESDISKSPQNSTQTEQKE